MDGPGFVAALATTGFAADFTAPVAILEPCIIGEATVSRATLHNIAIIESLDLQIGCMVEVIRAGEIIPQIVARVD